MRIVKDTVSIARENFFYDVRRWSKQDAEDTFGIMDTYNVMVYNTTGSFIIWLVYHEDKCIGMVELEKCYYKGNCVFNVAKIPHSYLIPKYRNMGVGKALYKEARTRYDLVSCRAHSIDANRLWTSLIKENEGAIEYFKLSMYDCVVIQNTEMCNENMHKEENVVILLRKIENV